MVREKRESTVAAAVCGNGTRKENGGAYTANGGQMGIRTISCAECGAEIGIYEEYDCNGRIDGTEAEWGANYGGEVDGNEYCRYCYGDALDKYEEKNADKEYCDICDAEIPYKRGGVYTYPGTKCWVYCCDDCLAQLNGYDDIATMPRETLTPSMLEWLEKERA